MTNHPELTDADRAAIAQLDAIPSGDNEAAHIDADAVLLALVHPEVRQAFARADQRVGGFWYA